MADNPPAMCGAHLSDMEVATRVRMLMRDDLDHEAVCVMARDRIRYLSAENMHLREALERLEDANDAVCERRTQALYDAMLAAGQSDLLIDLDRARNMARAALKLARGEG